MTNMTHLNRSHRVTDAMASQDFLYSVVTLDPGKEEVGVVDVHRRTLVASPRPATPTLTGGPSTVATTI